MKTPPILLSPMRSPPACASWRRDRAEMPPAAGSVHLVGVLKGAFVFLADLVRAVPTALHVRFPRGLELCRRHHDHGRGDGCSRISTPRWTGRHVVIVEDIVDTGLTLSYLQEILQGARSEVAENGVPAQQTLAPQGRRARRVHRLHDRGPLRGRIRPRLRGAVPQPALRGLSGRRVRRLHGRARDVPGFSGVWRTLRSPAQNLLRRHSLSHLNRQPARLRQHRAARPA